MYGSRKIPRKSGIFFEKNLKFRYKNAFSLEIFLDFSKLL
jgi:hypothetical protein